MPVSMRCLFLLLAFAAQSAAQTPPAPDTLDFSEVAPQLVGGIETLQRGIAYPAADLDAGTEGRVIVRFVVLESGKTTAIRVVRSISPGLDSASVAAVRAARFTPGTQSGAPVNVRMTLPVSFRLATPPADEEPGGFDGSALLERLGEPWVETLGASADSGAVAGGAGRLLWRAPGRDAVTATISGDTLRTVTFAFGTADATLDGLRTRIADASASPGSDGFYRASALAEAGLPARFDLRLGSARLTMRQATCRDISGYGCVRAFPVLVGGMRSLIERLPYPPSTVLTRVPSVVTVTFVVQPDGTVSDVRIASTTAHRVGGAQALEEAARNAVRVARFLPAMNDGAPVAAPSVITLRYLAR